jgi:periplasmic divalent cation tolerance protein
MHDTNPVLRRQAERPASLSPTGGIRYVPRMPADPCIVLCTVPDRESAARIAGELVKAHLAACVNIVPGISSVYEWKGALETSDEILLLVKSRRAAYPALERAIRSLHPYELPEIVAVPIQDGLAEYLSWIESCVETT